MAEDLSRLTERGAYDRTGAHRVLREHYLPLFAGSRRVLDLGCGRGAFLEVLRAQGIAGLGVDASPEAIGDCRARGLEAVQGDALAFLEETADRFDGVFLCHLIEHFIPQDAQRLLRLCARVTNSGGVLVVVTPNPLHPGIIGEAFWEDPTHVRPYPLSLLKQMVERAGYRITRATHLNPAAGRLTQVKYRLLLWLMGRDLRVETLVAGIC
jgi:SAM-dependent methyltransferase